MQPSRFNIVVNDYPEEGAALIYNSLSGALYELEPEYRQTLERLAEGKPQEEGDAERLEEMAAENYVVADWETERARAARQIVRSQYASPGTYSATVLTTSACNLACKYCFEQGLEDNICTMTIETADKAFDFITRDAERVGCNSVSIEFYGGEPLLNIPVIEHLSARLSEWCGKSGRKYGFTMTTNGTLFTPEMAKRFKEIGLKGVRISVDGVADVHDARRPFRGKEGSTFETLMQNLPEVVKLVPVTIVCTYDNETVKRIPEFLDFLEEKGVLQHLGGFQVGPQMSYVDKEGRNCSSIPCAMGHDEAETFAEMLRLVFERGIPLQRDLLQGFACAVVTDNGNPFIGPDGHMTNCVELISMEECRIGHVGDENYNAHHDRCATQDLWKECLDVQKCPYAPICGPGAGCRFYALVETGDLFGHACDRGFYDVYMPRAMVLEYEREQKKEAEKAQDAPAGETAEAAAGN